jgi:hypothetical protein
MPRSRAQVVIVRCHNSYVALLANGQSLIRWIVVRGSKSSFENLDATR